ncbi:MAG: DUF1570 domain-containing protein [Planctomycetaceae bacterium]|nr:DUF1570 domain-containing protein [Planctomycetaceae bacterium]
MALEPAEFEDAQPSCRHSDVVLRLIAGMTIALCVGLLPLAPVQAQDAAVRKITSIVLAEPAGMRVDGYVVAPMPDGGVLLEHRNGRLEMIKGAAISERSETEFEFQRMNDEEMGTYLTSLTGPEFHISQTDHYIICANTSEAYAEYVGRLLDRVYGEYSKFVTELGAPFKAPTEKFPVIILGSVNEFQEFAKQQHPETSFEDTPGYYSIRENQVLLQDLTRDRSLKAPAIRKKLSEQPLQLATIVHEAVHQLAFNTGLQVRMADNPVWFSEGLATYFEQVAVKSPQLWTKPGLVNARHHAEFVRTANASLSIPLETLLSSEDTFLDSTTVATAYAESWALVYYLQKENKEGFGVYMNSLSRLKPIQKVSPEMRLTIFKEAFGASPEEVAKKMIPVIKKLRAPK